VDDRLLAFQERLAKRRDWVVKSPDSYSGVPGLKSRPKDQLSWPSFLLFFSLPPG
jgi:hypothetical protein